MLLFLWLTAAVAAIELNINDPASIKKAASVAARDMMVHYNGNQPGGIPGLLPGPYYWWEAGAMFGSLIDYWFYTGDAQYNDIIMEAMMHQTGPNNAFMPPNQTKTLGNDDQAFWGFAAMSAAENKFPNPPDDKPQWLALAQAVFNTQVARWDHDPNCDGGLRWQIFTFNNGYNYKNTISNGCFFTLAARLARYTKNNTYVEWAEKSWDWTSHIGLRSEKYEFFDGTDMTINCTRMNHLQWTYNAGVYLLGAASLYNYTQSEVWKDRTQKILNGIEVFFPKAFGGIMQEVACERVGTCNVDQRSFKAYLSRWMATAAQLAPFAHDQIMNHLRVSAQAAARTCNGGPSGSQCSIKWFGETWDGMVGVGEQMSAMAVIAANLIEHVAAPVTSEAGISRGDPNAGTGRDEQIIMKPLVVTTKDRVGAGVITVLLTMLVAGTTYSMVV